MNFYSQICLSVLEIKKCVCVCVLVTCVLVHGLDTSSFQLGCIFCYLLKFSL